MPHPTIISESGRALVAYHSVLVFDVLGTSDFDKCTAPDSLPDDAPEPIRDLFGNFKELNKKNFIEYYHDASEQMEKTLTLFNLGHLSIELRALAERLFWAFGRKLQRIVRDLDYVPEELDGLDNMLSDTYFCNFSVFQSMPDAWAIKQLFPLMPIHRLNEAPTRLGVLGDITCDSDGKIDQFIDLRDVRSTLELHPHNMDEPY
ncbi:MAG TPA: arginine decarboxylase, partial [Urbifossiella sp.]|nr:arginine decarboxylase [Urbifossiella sp.]